MDENLKPCPFCGSEKILVDEVEGAWKSNVIDGTDPFMYSVSCLSCESEGPSGDDKEKAIEQWNKRI